MPIPASPAIPLAGRGFYCCRVRRRQAPGTALAKRLRRPRSSGTSGAVSLPGGARAAGRGRRSVRPGCLCWLVEPEQQAIAGLVTPIVGLIGEVTQGGGELCCVLGGQP